MFTVFIYPSCGDVAMLPRIPATQSRYGAPITNASYYESFVTHFSGGNSAENTTTTNGRRASPNQKQNGLAHTPHPSLLRQWLGSNRHPRDLQLLYLRPEQSNNAGSAVIYC